MERSADNSPSASTPPSPSLMLPPKPEPLRLPRSRAGSIASNKLSPLNPATLSDSNKPSPLGKSVPKTGPRSPTTPTKTNDIESVEGVEKPHDAHETEEIDTGDKPAKRSRDSVILTLNRTETAGGTQWEGLYNELDGKYLGDIQQKVPEEDVPMKDHLAGLLHAEEVKHAHEAEQEIKHAQVHEDIERQISDENKKPEPIVEQATEKKNNDSLNEYERAKKELLENPSKEPLPEPLTPEQLSYHARMVETVRQKLEEIPIPFTGFSPSDENKSIENSLTFEEQKVKENVPVGENKPKENASVNVARPRGVGLYERVLPAPETD